MARDIAEMNNIGKIDIYTQKYYIAQYKKHTHKHLTRHALSNLPHNKILNSSSVTHPNINETDSNKNST